MKSTKGVVVPVIELRHCRHVTSLSRVRLLVTNAIVLRILSMHGLRDLTEIADSGVPYVYLYDCMAVDDVRPLRNCTTVILSAMGRLVDVSSLVTCKEVVLRGCDELSYESVDMLKETCDGMVCVEDCWGHEDVCVDSE